MYQIMISAGEASGDMHGASLLEALNANKLKYQCFGMGSDKLAAAGTELVVDFSDLAVMGYVDVLLNYRRLRQRLQQLQESLIQRRPDILVLIDYASFNLKLAETARQLDIPVLFYISPKIWASRPGRIKKISACVSHMALIFPFEQEIFEKAGIPATYVGNPLLDQINVPHDRGSARRQLIFTPADQLRQASNVHPVDGDQNPNEQTWIGLVPGSRKSEIRYNLPVMLEAAALVADRTGNCRFILPLASTISRKQIDPIIADAGISIEIVEKQSHLTMRACDALLVGSGTATLEAAVIGTPMVTLYVMHWLNYMIMRRLVISPYVTLVNIQAGKSVVQELLQHDATANALAAETSRLLEDQSYRSKMLQELADIHDQMFSDPATGSVGFPQQQLVPQQERGEAPQLNCDEAPQPTGDEAPQLTGDEAPQLNGDEAPHTPGGASQRLARLLENMLENPNR